MKKILLVILISIIVSCKSVYRVHDKEGNLIFKKETINDSIKKNTFYNKEGNIIKISYYKFDYKEEDVKIFYNNGKIYQKGKEIYKKKDGWWYTYDSIGSNIIRKEYFINSRKYTYVELDALGKCIYYEIRPYIVGYEDIDTILLSKYDSIQIKFFKSSERLDIDKLKLKTISLNTSDDYQSYYIIYNQLEKNLNIESIYSLYDKMGVYYIELASINVFNETPCCCDSVYFDYTSRFIRIK